MKIIVAGAGIGGLSAALALLRRGMDVVVLEQAAQLREVGAGLQLSANATRALFRLGLEDELMAMASEPKGKRIRLWNTGQSWRLFDFSAVSRERWGAPYITIHRADLHDVLAKAVQAAAPQALQLGRRVQESHQTESAVRVLTASGEVFEGDVLIASDGVHSSIRRQHFGADDPDYSGIVAWRGVIDAQRLPGHLREPYGCNWVGPGAHVVHYPLRGDTLINFVGCVESKGWEVESWSARGDRAECLRDFAGWHGDVQTLIHAIDVPYKWALMVREPMSSWVRGRIALLGDACHPTLPFLAQGAAMAIEDGYVLARCLAQPDADIHSRLALYESLRIERTTRVVRGSNENARRFHNPELAHAEGAQAYVDREWSESRVADRYEWLFQYDVDALPLQSRDGISALSRPAP
ncbi:FAD-binding protein [Ramlibacter henchirensis]|uniref:FAD-binding protein n=1 Tax=Ramlibacter henchirensis TaxID=204072 RepID=A0A4Z0C6I1_9BURK|nr:FAD-dependent monooxygenase [Ramlibacter henchirensis]TFZ05675.1 FAD-binding protein [Ramlibacter henchirensis]